MNYLKNKFSLTINKCEQNCLGKQSLWNYVLNKNLNCPLGVGFCSAWDADNIVIKSLQHPINKENKINVA